MQKVRVHSGETALKKVFAREQALYYKVNE
jgi:hypothetical protein